MLNATLRNATLPEVDATVEVPLLGGIDVAVKDGGGGRLGGGGQWVGSRRIRAVGGGKPTLAR